MTDIQLSADGKLKHLLTLETLPKQTLLEILDTAQAIAAATGGAVKKLPILRGRTVVNLFFEPSTRTRTSFELAAKRLSADVVNFDVATSSASKGETVLDTLRTIQAMGCDLFVVRHNENGMADYLARHVAEGVAVMNGGDGSNAHPTQGLLDAYTIRQHFPDLDNRCVTIVGDIKHSRVARSDMHALLGLGVGQLRVCAPQNLLPDQLDPRIQVFAELDKAVTDADVIIMLRLQKERMNQAMIPSTGEYFTRFGLDQKRLKLAQPKAIVMHPGPMNRNVEIASEVADGPQSVILQQVSNGLIVRMAVMALLVGAERPR